MSHPPFRHRKTLLAMLVPALVHGIALAEEMPLGGIAVTAPEIADSLFSTPLAGDDLKRARASTSDTAKLLENVPGVSTYGAGGVSSLPAIHGLADDRLRIKVDGMDLVASCPNHMNPPLSYVDPSNVEAINVYAGITPVSVGGDSIGGSIIVDTFVPTFAAPGKGSITQGEVGAFYRSNGNAVGMNLNASHATESFQIAYSGALAKADNYKAGGDFKDYAFTGRAGHTLPQDEVGSTAYETRNHKLNLAFRKDAHLFEAGLNMQDLPFQLYPNQRMDMLDNEQQAINLRYLGQLNWGTLEARVYHEHVEHFMDFGDDKRYWYGADSGGGSATSGTPCAPISATCAAGMPMYTESKTTGASVKADIAL
ncbi:MAG: TonB-dependent receptor plug domain-containing protein, partial [Chromatiales bacterium]|nr:TonB-dependent receptor plug domain-containing protein [Chromatiales bacterium]